MRPHAASVFEYIHRDVRREQTINRSHTLTLPTQSCNHLAELAGLNMLPTPLEGRGNFSHVYLRYWHNTLREYTFAKITGFTTSS